MVVRASRLQDAISDTRINRFKAPFLQAADLTTA